MAQARPADQPQALFYRGPGAIRAQAQSGSNRSPCLWTALGDLKLLGAPAESGSRGLTVARRAQLPGSVTLHGRSVRGRWRVADIASAANARVAGLAGNTVFSSVSQSPFLWVSELDSVANLICACQGTTSDIRELHSRKCAWQCGGFAAVYGSHRPDWAPRWCLVITNRGAQRHAWAWQ